MAILTATQVTIYSNISASAATINASGLISIVQERIFYITNNYFNSDDLELEATVLFNATARSIVLDGSIYWENYGFQVNDDFLIYRSWRNDGVYTISSLSNETLIIPSSQSVVNERFNNNVGPAVYFSVIRWPVTVQQIAAKMIAFDYDYRDKTSGNIKSHSLGPFSESLTTADEDELGYPKKITSMLDPFKLARLN
jgi:hypothetical protein